MWRVLLLYFLTLNGALLARADQTREFDKVWSAASTQLYIHNREQIFSETKRLELRGRAKEAQGLDELSDILNPFLLSLGVSHTHFYANHDPDYYVLRSLFTTRTLDEPKINHIGVQLEKIGGQYFVRAVLDGYPAAKAGLLKGDRLQTVNGKPFHPFDSFNPKRRKLKLGFIRHGKIQVVQVQTVLESPHESFALAMKNSVRIFERRGKKIGYVHLWCGTNERFLETLSEVVLQQFHETDALILDLRDGFGGAWWDYLDPFYADSSEYFKSTFVDLSGQKPAQSAPLKKNSSHYAKPMVALINSGVRSGKEALTYQLKKTKRATLIGEPTMGAFAAGKGVFADEKEDFILYLAVGEILLDGNPIEGHPIQPDIAVPFPVQNAPMSDPQLEAALKFLGE